MARPPARDPAARGARSRLLSGGLWLAAGALTAAVATRASGWCGVPAAVAAQSLTPWALLAGLPLTGAALAGGRPRLAALTATATAAQLPWAVADIGRGPAPVRADGTALRLVTGNMLLDNPTPERFAATLAAADADLVLVQELSPPNLVALRGAGLLASHPHQLLDPRPGGYGSALLSRLPLTDATVVHPGGWPMTTAVAHCATGPLRIVNVHTAAPVTSDKLVVWRRQLAWLAELVPPTGGRLVLAGDFNATVHHAPFRSLTAAGLRNAHRSAGRGWAGTYPTWWPGPELLRIDHVLVGDGIEPVAVESRRGSGSDHRPLVADLRLLPTGPTGT